MGFYINDLFHGLLDDDICSNDIEDYHNDVIKFKFTLLRATLKGYNRKEVADQILKELLEEEPYPVEIIGLNIGLLQDYPEYCDRLLELTYRWKTAEELLVQSAFERGDDPVKLIYFLQTRNIKINLENKTIQEYMADRWSDFGNHALTIFGYDYDSEANMIAVENSENLFRTYVDTMVKTLDFEYLSDRTRRLRTQYEIAHFNFIKLVEIAVDKYGKWFVEFLNETFAKYEKTDSMKYHFKYELVDGKYIKNLKQSLLALEEIKLPEDLGKGSG